MIKIFVKLYIIIFINANIAVVTPHYLCGKVEFLNNTKLNLKTWYYFFATNIFFSILFFIWM